MVGDELKVFAFIVWSLFSFWIGGRISDNAWASNADTCIRHECKGRIYKVEYDED